MDPGTFENELKCTYVPSPKRNRIRNCFLNPEFQKLVVNKCVNFEQELPLPDINKLYET